MSTKVSIAYNRPTGDEPGVHVYEEAFDCLVDGEPTVYLEVECAISVSFETLANGRATVTIGLPRKTAVAIGLLPPQTPSQKP